MFYNGEKDAPLHQEQKLSDAFLCKCDTISLEVKVHVINVNLEKGAELLEKCRTLKEYRGEVMSFLHVQLSQEEMLEIREQDAEIRKAKDVAAKMKADNEPIEKIIKYTGLTEEEIETL